MAVFIDKDGAQAQVALGPDIYQRARAAGLALPAYLNTEYKADPKYGTAYDQFKASLGLTVNADKKFGIMPALVGDVLAGRTIQAGAVNPAGSGTPFGNESRTLFPSVVIDLIEAYLQKDRETDKGILEQIIAYDQSIRGTNFEQPVINYTDVANNGPETARAQRIGQFASPAAMVRFTTSDKNRKIPTFSIGMEFSDQALQHTTLDLVGLTMSRYLAVEQDARVYESLADMINGDLDVNTGAITSNTTTSFDSAASGGVVTHKAWVKWLRANPKLAYISHVMCDIDTYLKIESRTGRPGSNNYDPTLARIDPQAVAMNPVVGGDVKFWIVDSAANGGPVAANTVVGIDARYAIARVRNIDAEYTATEAFVMQRAQAMRMDSSLLMYRLQNQAWSAMTIA